MKQLFAALVVALSSMIAVAAVYDPFLGYFIGDFEGRHYRVKIERVNANTYDGILRVDDERMQLDARRYGENMSGRLADEAQQMGFRARFEAGILIFETGDGRRLILRRSTQE